MVSAISLGVEIHVDGINPSFLELSEGSDYLIQRVEDWSHAAGEQSLRLLSSTAVGAPHIASASDGKPSVPLDAGPPALGVEVSGLGNQLKIPVAVRQEVKVAVFKR